MNAYGIIPSSLDPRLPQADRIALTDDVENPTGSENTVVTQATIDRAVARFHNAAGTYYVTPIAAKSDATAAETADLATTVVDIIVAIAAYGLMELKPEWLNDSNKALYWSQLAKSNNAILRGLQDRSFRLSAAEEKTAFTPVDGGAKAKSDCSPFADLGGLFR